MTSPPLDSTHGRTSCVTCHHHLWTAHMVERCREWHSIISLGRETRSNNVERCMLSSPFASTHSRTTSGVAWHHRLWAAHTVERRWALHAIIAFGQNTCRTTSGVACHHRLGQHTRSSDVGRGMPSSPLGSTDGRMASGVACHHRHWTAHTVGRRRACYAIIDLG